MKNQVAKLKLSVIKKKKKKGILVVHLHSSFKSKHTKQTRLKVKTYKNNYTKNQWKHFYKHIKPHLECANACSRCGANNLGVAAKTWPSVHYYANHREWAVQKKLNYVYHYEDLPLHHCWQEIILYSPIPLYDDKQWHLHETLKSNAKESGSVCRIFVAKPTGIPTEPPQILLVL